MKAAVHDCHRDPRLDKFIGIDKQIEVKLLDGTRIVGNPFLYEDGYYQMRNCCVYSALKGKVFPGYGFRKSSISWIRYRQDNGEYVVVVLKRTMF